MKILITGAAGFIGAHLTYRLIEDGHEVIGIDNYNPYYNVALKSARVQNLIGDKSENVIKHLDLCDIESLEKLFRSFMPEVVVNLAAQAGVRLEENKYKEYYHSNVEGFLNIASLVRKYEVSTFLYASSSSVYGNSKVLPFKEENMAIRPISVYGVTKLYNEMHSEVYFSDQSTKAIGMRFFTVYGQWGRPDMAYFKIINCLINEKPFTRFGDGNLKRDFTFISDTVESIKRLINKGYADEDRNNLILNIGGGNPFSLNEMIETLETITAKKLSIKQEEASKHDVDITFADYMRLQEYILFKPKVPIDEGAEKLITWISTIDKALVDSWVN